MCLIIKFRGDSNDGRVDRSPIGDDKLKGTCD